MTGYEGHVVAKRPQTLPNGLYKRAVIAAGKVCPSNRTLKQDVTDKSEPGRLVEEDDMARRVAGAMDDIKRETRDLNLVAILEPAVRPETANCTEAIFGRLVWKRLDQKEVILMRTLDGNPKFLRQVAGRCRMVEMAMSEEHLLDGDASFGGGSLDPGEVSPRKAFLGWFPAVPMAGKFH